MEKEKGEKAKQPKDSMLATSEQMNEIVLSTLESSGNGFVQAYQVSLAIQRLKELMTPLYMQVVMGMQNNRLGFKTDKPDGGYPEPVVKNCLIEAVLTGVLPYGNQFNIIAGNCYVTKEGFGYLLKRIPGLQYELIPALPRISADKGSAAVVMKIRWKMPEDQNWNEREIEFPIKVNNYMGADAVIGKGERKARAWLYKKLTGSEVSDGDINDAPMEVVASTANKPGDAVTLESLQFLFDNKQHLLTAQEKADFKRIIDNKEVLSYQKVYTRLNSL